MKSTDWENNQTTNSYYFNSSVLGRLLFEVDGSGGFKKAYVYSPTGQLLARQESNGVTWITTESQGATTKETNSSGTVTGTNELDPLGRAVDSSGAYNYDGTNDYGVPAAGFYTPGSVPGVCGTTFGVSMSCGIVRDWGIHQRSLQERIADNDWSLSRLRPNGEFWDNLDRGFIMVPEFEDRRDSRAIVYRKHYLSPNIDDWYRNLNTTQQANIAVDDCARRMFGVSMIAGGVWAQQGTKVAKLNFAPLEGTAILVYSGIGVVGKPVKTFSVFMDRVQAGSAELGGPSANNVGRARKYPSAGIYQTTDPDTGKSRFTNRGYVIDSSNGIGQINDLYGGLVNVYFGAQIHETGNVLASLTGKTHTAHDWRNPSGTVTKVGDLDGDTGAAFEQCVYEYMLSHR